MKEISKGILQKKILTISTKGDKETSGTKYNTNIILVTKKYASQKNINFIKYLIYIMLKQIFNTTKRIY